MSFARTFKIGAGLAGFLVICVSEMAHSAPGAVLSTPAPVQGKAPDKIQAITGEDATVSTQTGAFQYSFPIVVPPGRLGVEPKIALSYSSQGAIYGDLAAGWTISGLHEIKLDTSRGVREPTGWVSSMAGNRRLIPVDEAHPADVAETFRAQNDGSYARYRKMVPSHPFAWEVQTPDGWTYRFGELDHMAYADAIWFPLTSARDEYGNRIDYFYALVDGTGSGEQVIQRIMYSANDNANLVAHAKVDFDWTNAPVCSGTDVPVGAQLTFRDGTERVLGAGKLVRITTHVRVTPESDFLDVREITLGYEGDSLEDGPCPHLSDGSPLRLLDSISEEATSPTGVGATLPPITFDYGASIPSNFSDDGSIDASSVGNPSPATSPPHPLKWGFRTPAPAVFPPRHPRAWPSLETTLIDINGDGRKDVVYTDENAEGAGACGALWEQNQPDGVGTDMSWPPSSVSLPTLPWDSGPAVLTAEECSLTGQLTFYDNVPDSPYPWSNGCGYSQDHIGSYYAYRFLDVTADGRVDIVGAIQHDPFYDPVLDLGNDLPVCFHTDGACPNPDQDCINDAIECLQDEVEPCSHHQYEVMIEACMANATQADAPCFGQMSSAEPIFLEDDDGGGPGCSVPRRVPFTFCDHYVWAIFENLGNGTFSSTPQYIYSPIALETNSGDSPISTTEVSLSSSRHAFIDLDGDGALDALIANSGVQGFWSVWWGDGTGAFVGIDGAGDDPDMWPAPADVGGISFGTSAGSLAEGWGSSGWSRLLDVNGDGLPDLVNHEDFSSELRVFYNDRSGFVLEPEILTLDLDRVSYSRGPIGYVDPQDRVQDAILYSRIKPFDYDVDGRVDWIYRGTGQTALAPKILLNVGNGLTAPQAMVDPMWSEKQEIEVEDEFWRVDLSYGDLNGDGIYERFNHDGTIVYTADIDGHPPRLLHTIDNGRGATTLIRYAASSNGDVVASDPSTGRAMPSSTWVVDTLTVENGNSPRATWTYRYFYPEWNADAEENFGFRGFDRVETTGPLGSVTVASFDYALDYSGRQVGTDVYESAADLAAGLPSTISDTTWQALTLFDTDAFADDLVTYHPIVERTITCAANQTYADCLAQAPRRIAEKDYRALPTSDPVLYKLGHLHDRTSDVTELKNPGDKLNGFTYETLITGTDYLVRADITQRYEWTDTNGTIQIARSSNHYHTDLRFLDHEHINTASGPTNMMTTVYTYDTATGQVLTRMKPQQYAGPNNAAETYEYGPFKIHVSAVTNELGHRVEKDVDLGTGAILATYGPNWESTCLRPARDPYYCPGEGTRYTIDGFGRERTRTVLIDVDPDDATGPTWELVGQTTYYDSELPQRIRTETRIEYGGSWITVDERYDGLGQLLSKTTHRPAPKVDAVLTYAYDAAGNLVSFTSPDPSQPNETIDDTVTYTFTHDSLGRLTSAITPLGSGTSMSYDGLVTTTTEIAATGPIATTVYEKDPFGRIIEVREALNGGGDAITTYDYDGNDNLIYVENADGIITEMTHDWVGNRTSITRSGRTWTYEYDRNGNVILVTAPVPAGADPLLYTTSIVYDDLDRVESRLPGLRTLSAAEQDLYGTGLIDYTYDQGDNGIGHLSSVTLPGRTISYSYDELGRVLEETRGFDLSTMVGAPLADTRTTKRYYNALGFAGVINADGPTATLADASAWAMNFDDRGMPHEAGWLPAGGQDQSIANFTYSTAGFMTTRRSLSDHRIIRDELGRVQASYMNDPNGGFHFRERLTYWGANDVRTLKLRANGLPDHTLSFTYDSQHQLRTVTDTGGYAANFTYTPAGRLTSAAVSAPASAPQVSDRDVTYDYTGTPDPAAVGELVSVADGSTYAAYAYDLSGNTTSRSHQGQTWAFTYDGADHQRQVVAPDGGTEIYYYDHEGQRMLALEKAPNGVITRLRFWIGGTEIHYRGDGVVDKTLAYVSVGGQTIARIEDRINIEFLYHGYLGHLLAAGPGDDTFTVKYHYGPFGEILEQTGSTDDHLRRFNDKHYDPVSALSYYGARYYDPLSLSWTQADPLYRFVPDLALTDPRRANLYTFSLNNPLRYRDPNGLDVEQGTIDEPDGPDRPRPFDPECDFIASSSACFHKGDNNPYSPQPQPEPKRSGPLPFKLWIKKTIKDENGKTKTDWVVASANEEKAWFNALMAPMLKTESGTNLFVDLVLFGPDDVEVYLGDSGDNYVRKVNGTLIVVFDPNADEITKQLPKAASNPDLIMYHELSHVLDRFFGRGWGEYGVRLLENGYRHERGIEFRDLYEPGAY